MSDDVPADAPSASTRPDLTLPDLWETLPEPFRGTIDLQRPWDLLGEPLRAALERLDDGTSVDPGARVHPAAHLDGAVTVGTGTRIGAGAVLDGPAWIGRDVDIRPGAFVRGGCWIGDGAIVGASTEIKASILFPGARAPHLNYVGDSILGADVNLGAGTVLSNFRHDGEEITIPTGRGGRIATGRRKLGGVLGDGVATGCNCVLHPGTVVGRGSDLYPGLMLRSGLYPAHALLKLIQETRIVTKRP